MSVINDAVESHDDMLEIIHYAPMQPIYCLVHDNDTVFHAVKPYTVNRLTTALEYIEVFSEGDELVERALEFGVVIDLDEL